MINNVSLTGRLTKEIDLRYTSNGSAVGNFTLAVNRSFRNSDGETEADFINCVIWKKSAEALANYTKKGSLIGVEGRIQTRFYDNPEGNRIYITEVVVSNFSFLESKNSSSQQQDQSTTYQGTTNTQKTSYQPKPNDPFEGGGSEINISDDDLPF